MMSAGPNASNDHTPIVLEMGGSQFSFAAAHVELRDGELRPLRGDIYSIKVRVLAGPDEITGNALPLRMMLHKVIEPLRGLILVPERPVVGIRSVEGGQITLACGAKRYSFPQEDVALLPVTNTTPVELAPYLLQRLLRELPEGMADRVELTLADSLGTAVTATVGGAASGKTTSSAVDRP